MEHVTNNDIWLMLGRMDSKLDRVVNDTADHEDRVTDLEKRKNYERGIIASISGVISVIGIGLSYIFAKG